MIRPLRSGLMGIVSKISITASAAAVYPRRTHSKAIVLDLGFDGFFVEKERKGCVLRNRDRLAYVLFGLLILVWHGYILY